MSMVEPSGCLDGLFVNGVTGDDLDMLDALDFPMESLEDDDDDNIGDWDASKSDFLGPIPSDLLLGPDPVAMNQMINATPKQKRPCNDVKEFSKPHVRRHNKLLEVKDPSTFQIQSPVSVLESNGSSSSKTPLPIKTNIVIPSRTRSKRVRSSGPSPWLSISPFPFPAKKTSNARKSRERMKKPWLSMMKDYLQVLYDHEELQSGKKCTHCEITQTPQWREGPMGPKTLCNACGVRYRSGRLFPEYRPAASPTFIPSLHSNSHRKVIEMRNKGKQQLQQKATRFVKEAAPLSPQLRFVEEAGLMSPQLEFVPMSSYLFDYV